MAELSGQGPVLHSGATTVVDVNTAASPAPCKLGSHGFDVDGNEYVYVDFGESFLAGEWCVFNKDYLASQITAASLGWVGLVIGTVSASDRAGWVQVRGVNTFAWATSDATTVAPVVTYATTDTGGLTVGDATTGSAVHISGIHIASAPDTCASTALSTSSVLAPCTVLLNYPFITGSQIGQASS